MRKPTSRPMVSFDEHAARVAELRATITAYKRDGVDPRVLAQAVEDLQAAEAEPHADAPTPADPIADAPSAAVQTE